MMKFPDYSLLVIAALVVLLYMYEIMTFSMSISIDRTDQPLSLVVEDFRILVKMPNIT